MCYMPLLYADLAGKIVGHLKKDGILLSIKMKWELSMAKCQECRSKLWSCTSPSDTADGRRQF